MVLAGCTTSPAQNSTDSNILDGSDTDSSDESIFVTATFIVGEGVTPIAPQTVIVGEKFKKPNDPIKDEYTFDGWFTDDSYSSLFNFDISYTTDQTIYAKWDKITYEYYLYGRLNDVDVFLPDDYKQEQYRLSTPHEDDSDAIKAIYNFHFMPDDEIHVIRLGSDGNEKIYNLDDSEEYGRGYYDLLLYENGISLRFIRYDEWVINFLSDSDAGDVFASFTKGTSDGTLDYYEANNIEVTAGQKLFLSYAWDYNPGDYFGIMCENEWPIVNNEPWVEVIHTPSLLYPDATTTVYEFKKDAKYDVTVCVRKDCTYNDGNMKVTFSLIDDNESIINENGTYNLRLIKEIMTNWITKDNQFGRDIITFKYGSALQEVALINPQNLEIYALAVYEDAGTMAFVKFEIGDSTLLEDMAAKSITTKEAFVERLNALTARKILVEKVIGIDMTVSSNEVLARAENLLAKVGSDADVVFAYETTSLGDDLTYGAGFWYKTVCYTNDSKLHVMEVSTATKEDVSNDTDKYGVASDNVTNIYEQNLEFYQDA